ncbi:MAG TPA: preprotein translocase subunit SecA [Candidatus Latescibacteria bacterium]|nr:preprotein translocase subunit SecA [Candidatus Latescibacterota bacterium]
MLGKIVTKIFGSKHEREIKKILPIVQQINRFYEEYHKLSDEELRGKTPEFRERLAAGETLDDILPEAYAAVKEVCRRLVGKTWKVCGIDITWDMVPFDVQLIGAVVLHQGKIAEMATGEGKTLVATMPLYLNAVSGKGAHLVTVNDYLARRDREWMGPVFEFLGLTVDYIQNDMDTQRRKVAYQADITYGTNNEFGFDYLRDNMAVRPEDLVQRELNYAIIDEVDSVLIDEARTPLIISGPVAESTHRFDELKPMVERLVRNQTALVNRLIGEATELLKNGGEYEAGIRLLQAQRGAPKNKKLLKLQQEEGIKRLIGRVEADFMRDKRMNEIDEELFYSIDEKSNVIDLTEKGRRFLSPDHQDFFVLPDLGEMLAEIENDSSLSLEEKTLRKEEAYREYAIKSEKIHNITQLLKAYSLFEKDVEYVVTDGRVVIVDEFTGRLMPGRRYSDGLHQALEAKENVKIERETQTLATITIQNFFKLYKKLAGMTGTAETEASEFYQIYGLDVVVIPTNEPVRRIDYDDQIYRTRREKYNAIINEIVKLHKKGLPVLVGTVSVEVSELLSRMLKRRGIKHSVLNAKYHQQEAEIVARAGQAGTVTIATNMAGRGTDIKLGKGVVKCEKCCIICEDGDCSKCTKPGKMVECVKEVPCGLQIIGTERHEARRIDRQLRGRSGRQGDPGGSRFFISLEDDLMRLFGSERIAGVMDRLGLKEGEVIQHPMVTRAIEKAQKRVEAHNFDIRKHLLEYDDVMNQQREVIYGRRRQILRGEDLRDQILEMIDETVDTLVENYADIKEYSDDWNLEGLKIELQRIFLFDLRLDPEEIANLKRDELADRIRVGVKEIYRRREELIGSERLRELERLAYLSVIDEKWRDHLYEMDLLKEGIGLRAYGQKDPLVEYKNEGFQMFIDMLDEINKETLRLIFRASVQEEPSIRLQEMPRWMRAMHQEASGMGFGARRDTSRELPFAPEPAAPGEPEAVGVGARAQGGSRPQRRVTVRREGPKVGRNDPCPCGSGKKYKKCCGR